MIFAAHRAADHPAVACARDAAADAAARDAAEPRGAAIQTSGRRCARRSATAATCCWCSASSPAAFSSLRHRAPAGLPDRPRPVGRDRRLDARRDRAVQHHRLDRVGLARQQHAEALHPGRSSISPRALAVIVFITLPASPAVTLIFGAVIGLLWLSTVPPTYGLVALMFGTRWLTMLFGLRVLQPSGRRLPRRLARRRRCSSAPAPTTWSGGSAFCSACSRR